MDRSEKNSLVCARVVGCVNTALSHQSHIQYESNTHSHTGEINCVEPLLPLYATAAAVAAAIVHVKTVGTELVCET